MRDNIIIRGIILFVGMYLVPSTTYYLPIITKIVPIVIIIDI